MPSDKEGVIRISGKQPVYEAVDGNWPIQAMFSRGEPQDKFLLQLRQMAIRRKVPFNVLEPRLFDSRFPGASQGIVAVVKDVEYVSPDDVLATLEKNAAPLFVALDGLEDPHNLGAICRTSLAMGASAVVIPRRRSVSPGEGAAKASAGAIFKIPICEVPNIDWFIRWSKENGFWVYGVETSGSKTIWETEFSGSVVVVIGSEGRGISRLVRDRCDFLVRIPMVGSIGSLNASVACGMVLGEIARQRWIRSK